METEYKFSLRLSPEMHRRLMNLHQKRAHMSLNALVVECIREAVERAEEQEGKRQGGGE